MDYIYGGFQAVETTVQPRPSTRFVVASTKGQRLISHLWMDLEMSQLRVYCVFLLTEVLMFVA